MKDTDKLTKAINLIKAGLLQDPRRETIGGIEGPRDYLFTKKVLEWISKLSPHASDALLIAAWGHTLYRWNLPRETYPKNTKGYHQWRNAQSVLSAEEVEKILVELEVEETVRLNVKELILKTTFPQNPDARILEDADCLAFLEMKFESYLSEWDEAKTIRILRGTLEKMTPEAIELAKTIFYSSQASRLIEKALAFHKPSSPTEDDC